MAFLDWVKNRGQAVSAPANEQAGARPETAKPAYTQEAALEKANTPPVTSLSAKQLAEVKAIGGEMQQISTPAPTSAPTSAPAPADAAGNATDNQQPQKQLLSGQEKGAPNLSPTSAQMGIKEAELPVRPADTPSPAQSPSKQSRSMSPDF